MSIHTKLRIADAVRTGPFEVAVEPDFDFGSEAYRALFDRSHATPFQGPRWLKLLYDDVAPAFAAERMPITVRDKVSGALRLVLPLVRQRSSGLSVISFADFGLCDYCAPVYDPDEAQSLSNTWLSERLLDILPKADLISLTKLRSKDPVLETLFPVGNSARMRASAYAITIAIPWADWRQQILNGSLRRELDLKRRRFSKVGELNFVLLKGAAEIHDAFVKLREFRRYRFQKRGVPDVFDTDQVFSFYRQIAIEGALTGAARTYCLYSAGEPAAVMFGLALERKFHLLLVGFDLQRYRRYSVGLLAIEDTVRASFAAGDQVYDFTIGDYPWKDQFGAQPTPLHERHMPTTYRGYIARLVIEAARESRRAIKPIVLWARSLLTHMRRLKDLSMTRLHLRRS